MSVSVLGPGDGDGDGDGETPGEAEPSGDGVELGIAVGVALDDGDADVCVPTGEMVGWLGAGLPLPPHPASSDIETRAVRRL